MSMRVPHVCLHVLLVSALAACSGRTSDASSALRVTRTDSAGIEIVATATAASDAPVFATLDSTPSLRLGAVDGPPEVQFGSVWALAALPDGGVAVLDQQAQEVREFSADGTYRRTLGEKGEGPGELSGATSVALLAGDTLAVYDQRSARVTRFGPDGELGRVSTLEGQTFMHPFVVSFFPDGSIVGQVPRMAGFNHRPADQDLTFIQDSASLVSYSPEGVATDTAAILPSGEYLRTISHNDQAVRVSLSQAAFGRSMVFAAHPDGIWEGFGDRFALRLIDPTDGHVKRILRAPGLDRPITDTEARAILDEAMKEADTPDKRRDQQKWYDLSPRPEIRPAYDAMVVDDHARLWIRGWHGAGEGPGRWWVFAEDGALLGSVATPPRMKLLIVRGDQAWGVMRDELDVSYVVRYTVRPATT